MGQAKRGRRSKDLKFKVALEAIKSEKTIAEIADFHGVHPNQVGEWKKQLLKKGDSVFSGPIAQSEKDARVKENHLVQTIGKQQIKIDWLKKKLGINDLEIGV